MISHLVAITGQEAEEPADGRGTRRKFTFKQSGALKVANKLSSTGMPPGRVRQCVEKVMGEFDSMFPEAINVTYTFGKQLITDSPAGQAHPVLIAWEDDDGFHCEITGFEGLKEAMWEFSHSAVLFVNVTPMLNGFFHMLFREFTGMQRKNRGKTQKKKP